MNRDPEKYGNTGKLHIIQQVNTNSTNNANWSDDSFDTPGHSCVHCSIFSLVFRKLGSGCTSNITVPIADGIHEAPLRLPPRSQPRSLTRIYDIPYSNIKVEVEAASMIFSPAAFSNVLDGIFPRKDGTNRQVCPPGGFPQKFPEKYRNPHNVDSLWNACKENWKSGLTEKPRPKWTICSKIYIFTANLIWFYGHCGHVFVERFDLNQSEEIDLGRKSFAYQYNNSTPNRFSPKLELF